MLYGAADASGNNNAGAASTSASGTYGLSATQLGGTALSLGSSKTYRNQALDKYGFEF